MCHIPGFFSAVWRLIWWKCRHSWFLRMTMINSHIWQQVIFLQQADVLLVSPDRMSLIGFDISFYMIFYEMLNYNLTPILQWHSFRSSCKCLLNTMKALSTFNEKHHALWHQTALNTASVCSLLCLSLLSLFTSYVVHLYSRLVHFPISFSSPPHDSFSSQFSHTFSVSVL